MSDEAAIGAAGAPERGRPSRGGEGVGSPLQARAEFLKNWDWNVVFGVNRGACSRGRAQHGINSEAGTACAAEWAALRGETLTLAETFDRLRSFHRKAPFLFFNGNTFATIGRELVFALFSDLVPGRKREAGSAVAHYIAGVLDGEAMVEIVESLCRTAQSNPATGSKRSTAPRTAKSCAFWRMAAWFGVRTEQPLNSWRCRKVCCRWESAADRRAGAICLNSCTPTRPGPTANPLNAQPSRG